MNLSTHKHILTGAVLWALFLISALLTECLNPFSDAHAEGEAPALAATSISGVPEEDMRTNENELTSFDEFMDSLELSAEEKELLNELDASETIDIQDGDLSIYEGLGEGWRNILLLGNDSRALEGNGRTDTMIIASINQQTGEIKLTSIMRDTLVKISGKSRKNKINAAFRYGGPNLAMKTVNEAFDLNIKEYAVVNLASFADIIDGIGGIDIDVSKGEMRHVNRIMNFYKKDAARNGAAKGKDFSELEHYGENTHLTGQQALAYSRIRKLDTDYRRTERQREVIIAIANKLAKQSMGELIVTGAKLWGSVRTNISFWDALQLGVKGASALSSGVEQLRIPADGTYKSGTFDGRWEIHADLDKNARLLHEFIYS